MKQAWKTPCGMRPASEPDIEHFSYPPTTSHRIDTPTPFEIHQTSTPPGWHPLFPSDGTHASSIITILRGRWDGFRLERLMRAMGLAGVRRGKTTVTTISNPKAPCPLDKVNREFKVSRPNALWVVDFTYVHTWAGFVYVAFVIDAFARRIVGWKICTSATADFILDALEQAIHARRPSAGDGLIQHSDRGVQYLAMNYSQRLAEANLVPSVGSVGDSYDNALTETINSLYKAKVIWRQRSWQGVLAVEMATLRWVDWFNNHRLFGPNGHIPPAEAEAKYYATNENFDMAA